MVNKFETGKLSAKGVIAIPIKVRTMLGVEEGDRLEFELVGDQVIVRGNKRKSILDAFGSLQLDQPLVDVGELRDDYRVKRIEDDQLPPEANRK